MILMCIRALSAIVLAGVINGCSGSGSTDAHEEQGGTGIAISVQSLSEDGVERSANVDQVQQLIAAWKNKHPIHVKKLPDFDYLVVVTKGDVKEVWRVTQGGIIQKSSGENAFYKVTLPGFVTEK